MSPALIKRGLAVHGESPDVSSREEDRADDVGVGRERDFRPADIEDGPVVERLEIPVLESGKKHLFDERTGERPAAAVAHHDPRVIGDRDRARERELFYLVPHDHVSLLEKRRYR
jgi:hypothetical protein